MRFECEICSKKVESNDCLFELQITPSIIDKDDKVGNYIHSPIYSQKICSWCAEHIHLICKRGMEKIREEEKD